MQVGYEGVTLKRDDSDVKGSGPRAYRRPGYMLCQTRALSLLSVRLWAGTPPCTQNFLVTPYL